MKRSTYIFIILQFAVNFFWINTSIPFCPDKYISYIASEKHCSCYLWHIFADAGIILFTLALLFIWGNYYKKHYNLVLYFFIGALGISVIGNSLSAINGLVGAIGPSTILVKSLWSLATILILYSLIYFFLVLRVSKSYKTIAFIIATLFYIFSIGLIIKNFIHIIGLSN